ncbi:MAG: Hsp33 family molecular chaperone HslO [Nitrosomonadales bacterium]|nr:Hsp33 family molecular chaperone HslO [Nitrosomonadales bacterium]
MSATSKDTDILHRFTFDNTPIRGNTVHLHQSFMIALQNQEYPAILCEALGELMAAGLLLAATLKMHGALVLQIQGRGALKLLVVECTRQPETEHLTIRATAKFSEDKLDGSLLELIGDGHFVITLDPKDGGEGYQGIVPLEGADVAEILENYMRRSEQIETSIWLACDGKSAAGMLLQKLPNQQETDLDAWNRANVLAETVQNQELLELSTEELLTRLFHEEDVRLYDGQAVQFLCSCSRDSVSNMLRMLGEEEIKSIIEERGELEVHCDFCNQHYRFDKVDSEQLFVAEITIPGTKSRH